MQAASLSLSEPEKSPPSKLSPHIRQFLSQFPLLLPNAFAVPDDKTTSFEFNPTQLYGEQKYVTAYRGDDKEAFKTQFVFLICQLEQWITQQNYTAAELQGLDIPLAMNHLHTELFQPGYADLQPEGYFEKIKTNLEWIFQWLQQDAVPLSIRRHNLVTHLPPHNVCSPGLPKHFAEWKDELQQEVSILHWLLKYRKALVKKWAVQHSHKYRIPTGDTVHVHNVYTAYAVQEGFIPKEGEINETFANLANVSDDDLIHFHQRFLQQYSPQEILDYLVSQFSDAVEKIVEATEIRKAGAWLDLKGPAMKLIDPIIEKLGFQTSAADLFVLNEEEGEFGNWSQLNIAAIHAEFLHRCFVENVFAVVDNVFAVVNQETLAENIEYREYRNCMALSYFVIDGKPRLLSDCLADASLTQMLLPLVYMYLSGNVEEVIDEEGENCIRFTPRLHLCASAWLYPFMSANLATAIFDHYFNSELPSQLTISDELSDYVDVERINSIYEGRKNLLSLNKEQFFSLIPKLQYRHIIEILHKLSPTNLQQFFENIDDIKRILKFLPAENTACFQAIKIEHIIAITKNHKAACFALEHLSEDKKSIYIIGLLPFLNIREFISIFKLLSSPQRIACIPLLKDTTKMRSLVLAMLIGTLSLAEITLLLHTYEKETTSLVKEEKDLRLILKILSVEKVSAFIDLTANHVSTIIPSWNAKEKADFKNFLNLTSLEKQTTFVLSLGKYIGNIINDSEQLEFFWGNMSAHQKNTFIQNLGDRVGVIIPNQRILILVLKELAPDQQTAFITKHKNHIATIITTSEELRYVLEILAEESKNSFMQALGEHIRILIQNRADLNLVLRYLSDVQLADLIQTLGKEHIRVIFKNAAEFANVFCFLSPDRIMIFTQPIAKSIAEIIQHCKAQSTVLSDISLEQAAAFIQALEKSICTLIPDINTLCDVCNKIWEGKIELKKMLIEILYPYLVTTEEKHEQLILNLPAQADFLNSLRQNLVSRLGNSQRLQMLHEPEYDFEWNNADDLLNNLRRLFTLDPIKYLFSPHKEMYEKILRDITRFGSTENLDRIKSLMSFFESELLVIDKKTPLPSSSQNISFFAALQTPLEKSDVALRMQFALKKLEEKRLALASEREEVSFDPARVILSP
jgi:hypothetical protein